MKNERNDIRWQQRFSNFSKAYNQLQNFILKENLNELENQGLIQAFEYTYELAWNTLQDLLFEKGYLDIAGPKPVIEKSFQDGYIEDGRAWMKMHKSRNLSFHTYNEEIAKEIVFDIRNQFIGLFNQLNQNLSNEIKKPINPSFNE